MARKYEMITELYHRTQQGVTAPQAWQGFLSSACRNYRLSFDEQLLVYAQRPDATAVLEIERWNRQFGRWVNRGATGIAVFDGEHDGRARLKYYFDVSDTHAGRFSRAVPLWSVQPEYEPDIAEALENSFGELADQSDLAAVLLSAAKNAVEDNMPDYLTELRYYKENSFLEELDDFNIEVLYRTALQNSVGYLDNDAPGRMAAKALMTVIPKNYAVTDQPPPHGKDFNDYLLACLKDRRRERSYER